MNKLESTLKHNLEVGLENAKNVILNPDQYTYDQRLTIFKTLCLLKIDLIFIDTFEKEKEGALNCFANADEWIDQESDVQKQFSPSINLI